MIVLLPEYAHLSTAELARKLGVTATAVMMARRRAAGLCQNCGSPATHGIFCAIHHKKATKERRRKEGSKPWKAGSPGRPPRSAKKEVNQQ